MKLPALDLSEMRQKFRAQLALCTEQRRNTSEQLFIEQESEFHVSSHTMHFPELL
ncbi:MAG TPA: hypothetical protein VI072_02260 [Polyangiaceae bacterium]